MANTSSKKTSKAKPKVDNVEVIKEEVATETLPNEVAPNTGTELVDSKEVKMGVFVYRGFDCVEGAVAMEVKNLGGGDVYACEGDSVECTEANLVLPGQSVKFNGAKSVMVVSPGRPTIQINQYK